jgi:hypothetical protein
MLSPKDNRSGFLPCGCHILHRQLIVHCPYHQKTGAFVALLRVLRNYFIDTTGEESPFVQKIDEVLPREK